MALAKDNVVKMVDAMTGKKYGRAVASPREEPGPRKFTETERAVFKAFMDPDLMKASNQDRLAKCLVRGRRINRATYYRIINDRWFVDQVQQAYTSAIGRNLGLIIAASLETACRPGREGYNDRQMLLKIAGILSDDGKGAGKMDPNEGGMGLQEKREIAQANAQKQIQQLAADGKLIDMSAQDAEYHDIEDDGETEDTDEGPSDSGDNEEPDPLSADAY